MHSRQDRADRFPRSVLYENEALRATLPLVYKSQLYPPPPPAPPRKTAHPIETRERVVLRSPLQNTTMPLSLVIYQPRGVNDIFRQAKNLTVPPLTNCPTRFFNSISLVMLPPPPLILLPPPAHGDKPNRTEDGEGTYNTH